MPIVLNGSGPITGVTSLNTTVSDTEIGYLDGVTSALQTQINTAGGLVKITDVSFSASSAVNVNSCFTTSYENYRILLTYTATTGDPTIRLRYRASGSDNSTANYQVQKLKVSQTTSTPSRELNNTFASVVEAGSVHSITSIDVFAPQLSRVTTMSSFSAYAGDNMDFMSNRFNATDQFDGFTVYPSSSTITGNLRVYGYRN